VIKTGQSTKSKNADDSCLDFNGTADGNVEGPLNFDGTEDGIHDGSLDSVGINKDGKFDGSLDSDGTADGRDDDSCLASMTQQMTMMKACLTLMAHRMASTMAHLTRMASTKASSRTLRNRSMFIVYKRGTCAEDGEDGARSFGKGFVFSGFPLLTMVSHADVITENLCTVTLIFKGRRLRNKCRIGIYC
jgi:hypothetical protein